MNTSSNVLIFDTETTDIIFPVLIEAAGIYIEGSPFDEQNNFFIQRYNPEKPISYGAMAIHNILDEELLDCPKSSEFKLDENIKYIIGHNIDFDWSVISKPDVKRIDTCAMAKAVFPEIDSHSLASLSYALCEPSNRKKLRETLKTSHNALTDAKLCLNLLRKILIKKDLHKWSDIYSFSEEARIPKAMPFGKYKGTSIKDIPPDYKEWLKKQPDIDEYLLKALN
ncbi:MAG: 3'-5' exonuclease [Candidatus Acididesulfobacter diazotrophicus]|uniref:3'-5' exonuclease n=1 Tax=Candidatus Acididesulfobacter diazotrophicus TaxID=2597226 RepID=A0A519BKC4_9DELT|nr:MAG: 3'-5' exonuclease [Candidatus Acididesulfobacter diazotrophicus]